MKLSSTLVVLAINNFRRRFFHYLALVLLIIVLLQGHEREQRGEQEVQRDMRRMPFGDHWRHRTRHGHGSHDLEASDGSGEEASVVAKMWEEFQDQGREVQGSVRLSMGRMRCQTQADVKGANMDHNMSISNPCVSTSDLLKRAYLQPLPTPFSGHGHHHFIMRSAYRISPHDFVAIGMHLHQRGRSRGKHPLPQVAPSECFWTGRDGTTIEGQMRSVFPGEHHHLMYETVLHFCRLDRPTPRAIGGTAVMILEGQRIPMYSEGPKAPDPSRDPDFFFGFCSFPMYRSLSATAVQDWLKFHHFHLGIDFFVLHDGGSVDMQMYEVLRPYVDGGVMEIVDIRGEFKYETKHNVLTLNDCLHRMVYKAHWALFLDFDEYLYAVPPHTMVSVLRQHEGAPYMTFGSLWWSVDLCRNPGAPHLERMLFHWPHFYCVKKIFKKALCLNYWGHRKFLVDPRRVDAVNVHQPGDPKLGGVDLDANIVHMNHFQGLLRKDKKVCKKPMNVSDRHNWWKEDLTLMQTWLQVKGRTTPELRRRRKP